MIVTTHQRPHLVGVAVASVVEQTFRDTEILVVVDGADAATEAVLAGIDDPRLRTIVVSEAGGAQAARNRGIEEARADVVALLDDDDRWLPTKLARQVEALRATSASEPIVFCGRLVRLPDGRDIAWRDRPPGRHEHPSEYLFVRRSLRLGESTVSTSTIMARRSLMLAVPFAIGIHRYDDADWVLRAVAAGAELVYVPDRLAVWAAPVDGQSITGRHATDWRQALDWIRDRRGLVTRRAYAAFILVRVAAIADRAGDRHVAGLLWREARSHGSPGVLDVVLFAGRWIVPDRVRRLIRARLASERDGQGVA